MEHVTPHKKKLRPIALSLHLKSIQNADIELRLYYVIQTFYITGWNWYPAI